ncbi:V-set domain-containing T-cell activation inhibitor 1-like [Hyperolius riggenbachi]|uniref:V-set domain-containing T-cell activation inhibitor 1-like n=1 Tax=Hyperolius riggenbachi TaxID=752182 RepID=UPI0035A322AB
MALLYCVLTISLLVYLAECDYILPKPQYEEILVPRFGNATLTCQFSFIENTYDLGFSWHREDIVEEIEVDDIQAYIQQRYEYKEPQLVYSFHKDREDLQEQSYHFQDRVRVDINEIPEGDLSMHIRNVDYQDEGLYTCKAISPYGKGEVKLKLLIQEEEEPPVTFDTVDNATVVRCVSKAWYKVPIVRWQNRREDDVTDNSTVEVLEQKEDGSRRVISTLTGVKSNEIYRCFVRDVKKARRARTIWRKLKKGALREYGEF